MQQLHKVRVVRLRNRNKIWEFLEEQRKTPTLFPLSSPSHWKQGGNGGRRTSSPQSLPPPQTIERVIRSIRPAAGEGEIPGENHLLTQYDTKKVDFVRFFFRKEFFEGRKYNGEGFIYKVGQKKK